MKIINFFKKEKNIWKSLKKNGEIKILAPMADVTDNSFRKLINEIARPDLFFTEFVAADGLSHKDAKDRLIKEILSFEKSQKPIVAQIFGGKPENFYKAGKIISSLGFDGMDINFGCPQKNILKQKAGSELIKIENRELASSLIEEAKKGLRGRIPLSVKTRIGFNEIDLSWLEFLLNKKIDALTVHLRTRKEMSKVPAHFDLIPDIVNLRNKISPETVLIINGDIKNLKQGRDLIDKYSFDGFMIGRGIFENPLLFADKNFSVLSIEEKINILKKHTKYFDFNYPLNENGKRMKNFAILKRFFKIYINDFEGAKELRSKLMNTNNKEEVFEICDEFLKKLQ